MSKAEILNSSIPFLMELYKKYVKRACENLGVSSEEKTESNDTTQLSDADYPSEFVSFSQAQRDKKIEESGVSDEEFLSGFSLFKH